MLGRKQPCCYLMEGAGIRREKDGPEGGLDARLEEGQWGGVGEDMG